MHQQLAHVHGDVKLDMSTLFKTVISKEHPVSGGGGVSG